MLKKSFRSTTVYNSNDDYEINLDILQPKRSPPTPKPLFWGLQRSFRIPKHSFVRIGVRSRRFAVEAAVIWSKKPWI